MHLVCKPIVYEHSKLFGIYLSNQISWCVGVSGQQKIYIVCWWIRSRLGHRGGFHIISVKCFYLTAVTGLDKLMSVEVFVVYYEITLQTRVPPAWPEPLYIIEWLKVAGRAFITHGHSEGQCKEHRLVLALSVFNHVWQPAQRLTAACWLFALLHIFTGPKTTRRHQCVQ